MGQPLGRDLLVEKLSLTEKSISRGVYVAIPYHPMRIAELNKVVLKVQHIRAARGQSLIINSVAPLREGGMSTAATTMVWYGRWYGMVWLEVCEGVKQYSPLC